MISCHEKYARVILYDEWTDVFSLKDEINIVIEAKRLKAKEPIGDKESLKYKVTEGHEREV